MSADKTAYFPGSCVFNSSAIAASGDCLKFSASFSSPVWLTAMAGDAVNGCGINSAYATLSAVKLSSYCGPQSTDSVGLHYRRVDWRGTSYDSGMGSGAGSGVLYVRGVTSAPNVPSDIAGTAGNTQVSLTWSAPASNGGSVITDYVIQYSTNAGTNWTTFNDGTSTSASAVVTGLTNGTTYIFKVAAVNSVGTGNYSSHSSSLAPAVSGGSGDASSTQGSSFCAVGSEVWGGFTYSGLTAGQCRDIFLDTCSNNADDTPCACGHPFPANSCTEYYQTTQVNSRPGVVSPISQEICPDAMLAAARQINEKTACENFSASHPEFNARWIQRSEPGYNVAGSGQVGVNGKYCKVGLHNNYPLYKGNVKYSGYDTYIYVSTAMFGYWVIGTRPFPTDDDNSGSALFVSGSSSGVSPTPPLDAWQQSGGDPPVPTLSVTSCD
jgi:hypothetical protein